MQREREMALKLEDECRRLELEFTLREKTIEDRTREMMRLRNEQLSQEDDLRRREMDDQMRSRITQEKTTIEVEFNDHRQRLERQISAERAHEKQLVESMRREKLAAEERANTESCRSRVIEQELTEAKKNIVELRAKKDDLAIKMTDFDKFRIEAERLRSVEIDNRQLRDWRRDHESKVVNLTDRNVDLERTILGLRNQVAENDALMNKFAEELR